MSRLIPVIELQLNASAVHAGDTDNSTAGEAIAAILRAAADRIERDINLVPYGTRDWQRETHSYDGVRLILDEKEIHP